MWTSLPARLAMQVPFNHGQAVWHRATRSLLAALCAAALAACGDMTAPETRTLGEGGPPGSETSAIVVPPPAPTHGYHIYLANPSGLDLRQLARGHGPAWSPEGSKIAFEGADGTYIMDVSGTAQWRLRGGASWLPRWSPEGSKIAFVTCIPNGGNGPFPEITCDMTFGVINADGSGEIMLAQTNFQGTIPPAEWSPDGRKIAFVGGEVSRADLYVINTDGSGLAQLTQLGTVTGAAWSPDGRTLALRAAGSV